MAIDLTGVSSNALHGASEGNKPQVVRNEPTVTQQQTGKPSTGDTVLLTDTAARLRSLEKSLADIPVVDTQRVDNIRKALNNGDFDIEPMQVAGKMIDFESQYSQAIK